MTRKRIKILFLTVLVLIFLFLLLEKNFLPGFLLKLSPNKDFELLGKVIQLIKNDYIEEANPAKTMKGAFKGMVDSLDVLSSYLDKESMLRYSQRKEANLNDIGIILYKRYGSFPQVIGIRENSPAEKKGIQIGDFISSMDGRSTLTMSMTEANLYLKDRDKKTIKLRIFKIEETKEVNIERTLLFAEPFSFAKAKGTSGILKIHQLYPPCVRKIREEIIPRLMPEKRTFILDLRDCHEGDIEESRKLINLFLKSPNIGYFETKGGTKEILSCPDDAELEKLPLVIWTNQATIGPAEAVAGVLKEFKRAKIIGLPTLGLVAKQNFFVLDDGSGLLLTSGIFHLKSGEKLWEKGITPDIKINEEDQTLSTYLKKSL
ncbi:MAG TPA: PDZ domain-containing protein [Candidatus Aminicenantes bacterium]|nr:PDZ domain-containing protein [Candidatus Aminicenantes bacterium]